MKIASINRRQCTKSEKVYDVTVEGAHHYILENGVVSHNSYMPTKVMGGGSGLPYAASQIVTLTKSKERDDEKNVTGNLITCTMTKSRFTKENLKVKVRLTYDKGLDRYFGLMDLAIDNGIVTKDGNRYVFPDGQKAFMKHIEESPETYFTADFLNILEAVVTKTFKYGCPDTLNTAEIKTEDE